MVLWNLLDRKNGMHLSFPASFGGFKKLHASFMFFGFLKPSPPFLLLGDGLSLLLGDLLGWFCSSDCFPACLNLRFTERACIKQMTAWIRAVVYFALALTLFTGQIDVPTLFTGQIDSLIVDDMFDRVEGIVLKKIKPQKITKKLNSWNMILDLQKDSKASSKWNRAP
ncbi:hypothetical protein F2Q69_00058762 [Brassica cretica]|uniref:Uncharacterized protein n=1 Tax=Brassica cretica TaxID=69181 RepID=A0A8S9RHN8_BRACR|nr:hypothetical protein F2Q69_00058762 [Brassica cretica]